MTDIETAIMIKNMARETVRQMSAKVKNAALREVAVTYSDGTTITTSMAAHLSDADIKNYFRVGREFNIGSGAKDKMVKVKSVKILNTTAKNTNSILQQMADKYLKEYARLRGLVDAARKDVDKAYAEKNYKKADDAQKRLNKADADLQKLERDRSKLDARVDTRWDFLK